MSHESSPDDALTQKVNEQLSALWDGELSLDETAFLEKRLERDPQLNQTLARFALIGVSVRERAGAYGFDVAPAVRAAIRVESHVDPQAHQGAADSSQADQGGVSQKVPSWRDSLLGLAVAAGVAVLTVAVVFSVKTHTQRTQLANLTPSVRTVARDKSPSSPPSEHVLADGLVSERLAHSHEPYRYVTPVEPMQSMPEAEMARYVASHASLSNPMQGQVALLNLATDGAEE